MVFARHQAELLMSPKAEHSSVHGGSASANWRKLEKPGGETNKSKHMKSYIEKSDSELKTDVLSELKYEPTVRTTDIGVLVKDGAVTLNGYATSYGEKWDAVRATRRVAGVNAIADDIEVKLSDSLKRNDGDIASAAAHQIEWSPIVPSGTVQVTVRDGWVTLDGVVDWWYQKNSAENAVEHLAGVRGVSNLITIKAQVAHGDVEKVIKSAFERSAQLDANKIEVVTEGTTVTLRGKVRNYAEKEEAERAAWGASGVSSVDNRLSVVWSWLGDD
jgi:osmotically-inducible protein OsmY